MRNIAKHILALSLLLIVFNNFTLQAQDVDKFKAVFVLKFIENIQWPNQKSAISIGVLGNSRVLTELSNRISSGKLGHKVSRLNYLEEVADYDLIFVPDGAKLNVESLTAKIGNAGTLIVTSESLKGHQSADICFLVQEGKLRFRINEPRFKKKGIMINSKLLALASK